MAFEQSSRCPINYIGGFSNKLYQRVVEQILSEACLTDLFLEGCPMDFNIRDCP